MLRGVGLIWGKSESKSPLQASASYVYEHQTVLWNQTHQFYVMNTFGFWLFTGATSVSPVLASVCGRDPPGSIHSTGDSMFLHFSSDSRDSGQGFNASFSKGMHKYIFILFSFF